MEAVPGAGDKQTPIFLGGCDRVGGLRMMPMSISVEEAVLALTEKEKQTLRLMVRGHDAKSIARSLGLSVHTINERLRDARRKLAGSSSREAARMLLDAEGADATSRPPENLGDSEIGADRAAAPGDERTAPMDGAGQASRRPLILTGVMLMTLILGLLAMATLSPDGANTQPATTQAQVPQGAELVQKARAFLTLVDAGRWDDSYRLFGPAFRKLNTPQVWASVSEKVRVPLGAVSSRQFLSQQELPAPPAGYTVIKFRTDFAAKPNAVETVTLEQGDAGWQVVGVTIE
ncbi:LuxR family transcriptional regulator [Sphingobium lactosutens DS20]|uniref:LuxR family transcriptional regulator n=2 Tax=Sphingobium TaxID=165695 RepID=T0HD56_9SPHN|nr:LuxR family transcriptional regulator [Sphingobium lactosutens DS20]